MSVDGGVTISGPNDDLEIPLGFRKTDWEVELGGPWDRGKGFDTLVPTGRGW